MSRQINQPINQVKLTNVAIVRYNYKGKRFEIACYKNKVMDYRSGLETDLSEVLQTDRIFVNVSKGQFAKSVDLLKAFGTSNEEEIAKIILEKGNSMQVSNLEREQMYENTLTQIATWIASNCVHPDSGRPYTVSQIKHSLGKNYQVQPHKPIKKQYLDAVKFLKIGIPIERAKMELSLEYPAERDEQLTEALENVHHHVINEQSRLTTDPRVLVLQADPSMYRELNDLAKGIGGRLEILKQVVAQEGDIDLEQEIARKKSHKQIETLTKYAQESDSESESNPEVDHILEQLEAVRMHGVDSDDEDDQPQRSNLTKQRKAQQKRQKEKRRRETKERQGHVKASSGNNTSDTHSAAPALSSVDGGMAKQCNTCGGTFPSDAEYRAHFRSDWHRFNQKLKLKGVPPVSEEEFRLCDEETFFAASES